MVTEAPVARALLTQATKKWNDRDRASDGLISSEGHKKKNPTSDHDYGNAVDLDHDESGNGPDCFELSRDFHRRYYLGELQCIKYIIWNRKIWNPAVSREWRPYTGENPHNKHMHISILSDHRNDEVDWFPAPRRSSTDKEFKMDAEARQAFNSLRKEIDELRDFLLHELRQIRATVVAVDKNMKARHDASHGDAAAK